jgi:L-iditol 2-dehydrogenase
MSAVQEMTAAVLHGKEDIRIERVPVPEPVAGEIVIKVGAALTCGTDLKVYRRGYHAKMLVPPALFGHELAGTVHAVGEGVTKFAPGDRVVALNSAPCDACFYCERKQWNLCDDILFNNGAYAEFIRIPARIVEKNTLAIPDGVPFEHAALTEPLACVVRGLDECEATIEARPGDTVAVIGAGPIGLMFMHAAQIAGYRVIAVVKRDEQIQAAKTFGAAEVVQTTQVGDAVAAVRALTPGGRGVDMAIEAVATPATWEWAVDMVRKGGVVNFFGGCAAGTKVGLDTNRLHYNDIKLLASFHHTPVTARKAFALVTGGKFKCAEYITGRARLTELDSVFRKLMSRTNDIKTAILP